MREQEANRLENRRLDAVTREQIQRHLDWLDTEVADWLTTLYERLAAAWVEHETPLQQQNGQASKPPKVLLTFPAKKRKPRTGITPLDLLMSVSGIGLLTALQMYAVVGDLSTFRDARHLASYLG